LNFVTQLQHWHQQQNQRKLPWKHIKDPYKIWLSEIILQQTRAEQGLPYYVKFIKHYPTVTKLANANENEVLKLWQGLGYYSRARNLHYTAKFIANELKGKFPNNYSELLKLKGVGPYTAAAIASFAYNLPHAVVDGNVNRVISRFYGVKLPIDEAAGRKQIEEISNKNIIKTQPAEYNQAIMDFGATLCKPANPFCETCPMQTNCYAFKNNMVGELPLKVKKIKKKTRYFNYLVFEAGNGTYMHKRTDNDIWRNLYEFPLLESSKVLKPKAVKDYLKTHFNDINFIKMLPTITTKHLLTHQTIHVAFYKIKVGELLNNKPNLILTNDANFKKFAIPRVIDWYLSENNLSFVKNKRK